MNTPIPGKESNGPNLPPERIAWLVAGFLQQKLSEKDQDELDEWICASKSNLELFERLTDPQTIESDLRDRDSVQVAAAYNKLLEQIRPEKSPAKLAGGYFWQYVAAAVVIIAVGTAAYLYRGRIDNPASQQPSMAEITPGSSKAQLVLADGRMIDLYDTSSGVLQSLPANLVIGDGKGAIMYQDKAGMTDTGFHTLSVPIGGQYSVTLPDGTRVWLNAGSTLRYPATNTVKTRVVELTGEAYFEVATRTYENGKQKVPFLVKANGLEITVLGTQFNVSAYKDDESIRTTLVEGSISITYPIKKRSALLRPGQQAELTHEKELRIHENAPVGEIIAWKNGLFDFRNQPIEHIMRQVGRWYDAKVVYNGKIDYHFNATIRRDEPVTELLELLELTNRVHFRIENKTIFVTP